MKKNSELREKYVYQILGITAIATILYLNFNDQLSFEFPIIFWQKNMAFVGVNSTHFVLINGDDHQKEVYINGWNSYWLMQASVWEPSRSKVSMMLKRGAQMGLNVCRTWAFSDGPGPNSLQISPGVFNERVLKAIISRKNTLSGVKYYEEPAIFAWELINEPRCESDSSSPILQDWITEMVTHIKSLDIKHMVTIGLEVFYGAKAAEKSGSNPGEWAASLGTDFIQNSAVDGIDFASVHAYPDSWVPHANTTAKLNFISHWLDSHVNDGEITLKKPVLFTEVGYPLHGKGEGTYYGDTLLKTVYDRIIVSAKKGQAGAGALIWQLLVEGMEEYRDRFSLVAWKHPSTYKLILEQSCKLIGKEPCSDLV